MFPNLALLKCFAPPYVIKGLLPKTTGDLQIMCNDKLYALAIGRDDLFDIYVLGPERITMVIQKVPEKNILAEIGKMLDLTHLPD